MTTTLRSSQTFGLARLFRAIAPALPLALASLAGAQDLGLKAPPQDAPITIYNATIHTVSGATIEKGFIRFDKGKITEIAAGTPTIPEGAAGFTDAKGQHVYPGLIGASTQLGLAEMAAIRATNDINEVGDVTPEARAAVAVNPDSTLLPVTRANGVLIVGVFPEGGRIPGQVAAMRLDGWTWEQMAITQNAGLAIEWPNARPIQAWWMERSEEDQLKDIRRSLDVIDGAFKSAEAYVAAKDADPSLPTDLRYESMRGVLPPDSSKARQLPVFITAGDVDQITSAVTWAAERKLKMVLVGGRDAPLCAELLKKHDIPVIIGGTHAFPKRADSPYDDAYTLPKRLADAGVRFCIASADRTAHERNLPYNAATAAAFGLSRDDALKSITLWPAQILGIDAAGYGALEVGKSATLIVTTGDVLEITSNPTLAFIDGRKIDLSTKQSALAEKYREKYRQINADAPRRRVVQPPKTGGGAD